MIIYHSDEQWETLIYYDPSLPRGFLLFYE